MYHRPPLPNPNLHGLGFPPAINTINATALTIGLGIAGAVAGYMFLDNPVSVARAKSRIKNGVLFGGLAGLAVGSALAGTTWVYQQG